MTTSTRTKTTPQVVGERAADRLLSQCAARSRLTPPVTPAQAVTVLRALADYTHMQSAVAWRSDERPADPAFSVATWMHAVADQIELGEAYDPEATV